MKTCNRKPSQVLLLVFACCTAFAVSGVVFAQDNSALFWSIGKNGEPAGFLLGTIHSEDPRVLDFKEEFIRDLNTNDFFAMEIVPDLPTLARLTEYMQYQDGSTLESRIGPDRYVVLQSVLARYRVPADWVVRMKVWAAMLTLSVPPPETGLFMDFSLSLRAAGAGLKVVGLETLEQQLSFLEQMSMERQLALLDQAMEEQEKSGEIHAQMVNSYLQGGLLALKMQADEQLDQLDVETRQYFIEQGIDLRNQRMIDALLPLLQQGKVLTAVGALHLPGDKGLIQLLRDKGYDLEPLPLPLTGAAPVSIPAARQ
jgi:uncharacterized protein YbaP (TraB family)